MQKEKPEDIFQPRDEAKTLGQNHNYLDIEWLNMSPEHGPLKLCLYK